MLLYLLKWIIEQNIHFICLRIQCKSEFLSQSCFLAFFVDFLFLPKLVTASFRLATRLRLQSYIHVILISVTTSRLLGLSAYTKMAAVVGGFFKAFELFLGFRYKYFLESFRGLFNFEKINQQKQLQIQRTVKTTARKIYLPEIRAARRATF